MCLLLCLLLPRAGMAHPAAETRLDDLNRQIAASPRNAELFLQRAELHRERRSRVEAEADYAASRRLDPNLATVDFCLAKMRFATGRHADAIALLNRYLTAAPEDGAALALRATVRSELGEHGAAAEDYGHAIDALRAAGALPPPHLYLQRASALVAAGEELAGEALERLDRGLALLGGPIALELAALALELRLRRFDAALARVDRRLAAAQRPGPWLTRRGQVLEGAGRYQEALDAYRGAWADFSAGPDGRRQAPAVTRQIDSIEAALARIEARLQEVEGQADD